MSVKVDLADIAAHVADRGAATLAAELYLAQCGVEWIRTHDVQALSDALAIRSALSEA